MRDAKYLAMAFTLAMQSKAIRKKIGALIVKQTNGIPHIVSEGVNGTEPSSTITIEDEQGQTRPCVLHAEINAINKAKAIGVDLTGSTIYVSCCPCPKCCSQIKHSGIKKVVYATPYKDGSGIKDIVQYGLEVVVVPIEQIEYILNNSANKTIYDYSGWLRFCGFSEEQINHRIAGQHWKEKERGTANV